MKVKRISLLLLSLIVGHGLFAVTENQSINRQLTELGFESVLVESISSNRLLVSYESSLYVWHIEELYRVIQSVVPLCNDETTLEIITQKEGLPILVTTLRISDWNKIQSGQMAYKESLNAVTVGHDLTVDQRKLFHQPKNNSSFGKIDLVVYPTLNIRNLFLDRTLDLLISVSPTLETSLWKGNKISAQIALPVVNSGFSGSLSKIRPGNMAVSQSFRLPKNIFGSFSVGVFGLEGDKLGKDPLTDIYGHRYGVDGEIYSLIGNGNWKVGLNAGLTGFIEFDGFERINYTELKDLSLLGNISYFLPVWTTQFSLTGGCFYAGTWGVRPEVVRHFRNVSIGLYAHVARNMQSNGGFYFSVPLNIPKKYKRKFARIKAPNYFHWEYVIRSNEMPNNLYMYKTQPDKNKSEENYNSNFVREQLIRMAHENTLQHP